MADLGRPPIYDNEYHPKKVLGYCLVGMTDVQIAAAFDVSESTINNWKLQHPDFLESIKRGKEEADVKVAHSLFKRATGSKEKVQKWFKLKEAETGVGSKETLEMREEEVLVPADTGAAIFWLKNRQPQMWRDKKEIELSESEEITGIILTDDEEPE